MQTGTYFEIEIETLNTAAVSKVFRAASESEALAFVKSSIQPNVGLLVACLGAGVDHGNLIIEVGAEGACRLRALEHRGFFVEEASMEQAIGALQYWLPSQEKMPSLQWEEE